MRPRPPARAAALALALLLAPCVGATFELQIGQTGKAGGGKTLLNGPSGVHVTFDRIYVADTNNHRIAIYDLEGKFQKQLGGGEGPSKDVNNNTVEDPFERGSGTDERHFCFPRGVYATPDSIYVADTGNNRVMVYSLEGAFKLQIGNLTAGLQAEQFDSPSGVYATSSTVYVADTNNHRVSMFALDGTPLPRQVGVPGTASNSENTLSFPSSVAAGDFLFVADTKNDRVSYYDSELKFMGQLGKGEPGSGPLELFAPKGVSADENRIYVADTRNHRVGVFFRNGELDEHIGGADASGDYRLKGPSGVAVATYYVYVADEGNHRVAVFSKSATVSYTAFFAVLLVIALAIGGAVYYFRNELEELYSVVQGSKGFEVTEDPMKEAEEMRQELWNDGSGGAG